VRERGGRVFCKEVPPRLSDNRREFGGKEGKKRGGGVLLLAAKSGKREGDRGLRRRTLALIQYTSTSKGEEKRGVGEKNILTFFPLGEGVIWRNFVSKGGKKKETSFTGGVGRGQHSPASRSRASRGKKKRGGEKPPAHLPN